uniref:Thioredoxin domain-containing protein n=1 Tax=Polytomella parva TaxID=51329 RepID=A0A7S0UIS9_9CHLO
MKLSLTPLLLVFSLCVCIFAAPNPADFTSPHIVHFTSENFEEKSSDGKLYFVKFYAPWCGHCVRLAPTWKELAASYATDDQIEIAHVDCTADKSVCQSLGVRGYPSLKLIYEGEVIENYSGMRDFNSLKSFVDENAAEIFAE